MLRILIGLAAAAALVVLVYRQPAYAANVAADKAAIQASLNAGCEGFIHGDVAAAVAPYSKNIFLFDLAPKLHSNYDDVIQVNKQLAGAMEGKPTCAYRDVAIEVDHNHAYAHYLLAFTATLKGGKTLDVVERVTDVFERTNGKWLVVHEHASVPMDIMTEKLYLHAQE
ncbi:MAG TPA: nuclear transport factor 2 family protein [Steroidobacteraceae bacterium]|nr:nuclear transport factor 2 family protein [Steroidobacteraceae bacterium]